MFLKNGQFGPCRPLSGDWAGQVCKLSAAGRNVRTAREWPSHVRPQQWKSEDPWLPCPSLWKATSAQHNLQEGYGFTVSAWGQPIAEGDLEIAFLSGSREKKMTRH